MTRIAEDLTVRAVASGDAARLALVGAATFLESFADVLPGADVLLHCARAHSEADYRRRLASADDALWLAETRTGAPIGYAALAAPELPSIETRAADVELKRIYVLSRFHGSGIATALMEAAVAEGRARGKTRLLLGVYARNGRAIRFYEKSGFSVIGTRRFEVGDNHYDDVVMARPLAPGGARSDVGR